MISTDRISKTFALAGSAIFTVETPDGAHHTYRIDKTDPTPAYPRPAWFAKILVGPDNGSDYVYLGRLDDFTGAVVATARSRQHDGSYPLRLLNRVLARVWSGDHDAYERHGYRTHHEGRCGRCGRRLTVPESIRTGIGPECARAMELEEAVADVEAEYAAARVAGLR